MPMLFNTILENPLYALLFGGGGILVVIIAIVSIIVQVKKEKNHNKIIVKKSKKTEIRDNHLKNQTIQVNKSEDTIVSDNK